MEDDVGLDGSALLTRKVVPPLFPDDLRPGLMGPEEGLLSALGRAALPCLAGMMETATGLGPLPDELVGRTRVTAWLGLASSLGLLTGAADGWVTTVTAPGGLAVLLGTIITMGLAALVTVATGNGGLGSLATTGVRVVSGCDTGEMETAEGREATWLGITWVAGVGMVSVVSFACDSWPFLLLSGDIGALPEGEGALLLLLLLELTFWYLWLRDCAKGALVQMVITGEEEELETIRPLVSTSLEPASSLDSVMSPRSLSSSAQLPGPGAARLSVELVAMYTLNCNQKHR